MAFHWRDGWHFERLPNGDVRITERHPVQETVWFADGTHAVRGHRDDAHLASNDNEPRFAEGPYIVARQMVIPAAEWVSILAAVSAEGSVGGYMPAARLHQGG